MQARLVKLREMVAADLEVHVLRQLFSFSVLLTYKRVGDDNTNKKKAKQSEIWDHQSNYRLMMGCYFPSGLQFELSGCHDDNRIV